MSLDLDNNAFLDLLTDALRAGPGSPSWHQAVARLRDAGAGEADEYRLLLAAREHLESGKSYRSVRAGPGFTRKVLQGLDEQGTSPLRSGSTATLIAIVSGLVMVGVALTVAYLLLRAADSGRDSDSPLTRQVFTRTTLSAGFDAPLSSALRLIGPLKLEMKNGLRLAPGGGEKDAYAAAGVVTAGAIAPEETFAAEIEVLPSLGPDGTIVHLFVSDSPDFAGDKALSGQEFVVDLHAARISVLTPQGLKDMALSRKSLQEKKYLTVRLAFNRHNALVLYDNQLLWTGPHGLSADQPRYVGVRLLRKNPENRDPAVVSSFRLLEP